MSTHSSQAVRLRVKCVNPPVGYCDGQATVFGLQDKQGALQAGQSQPDGSLVFECELQAKPGTDGAVNFLGPYAHGTVAERFLYLSLRYANSVEQGWIRRMKVPLSSITWEQVESAPVLEATVDGQRAGTVRLMDGGWNNR